MGQVLTLYANKSIITARRTPTEIRQSMNEHSSFVDLRFLPPEISLKILSNLNATDLCLASCVWHNLACDDLLWQGLCKTTWPFCSAYTNGVLNRGMSYRHLYLRLDEARLTFNADAFEGINYLFKFQLLDDNLEDISNFLHYSCGLDPIQKRRLLESRPALIDALINLKDYHNHSLPNALRKLFIEIPAPLTSSIALDFISKLVNVFSARFIQCNPALGLTRDHVYLLCFSMIMLSADLWSPHIKNKMSKREFIRNTRQVVRSVRDEFLGHLYDNVYIVGHVVLANLPGPPRRQPDPKAILIKA